MNHEGYYGTGETFVFTLEPNINMYKWSEKNLQDECLEYIVSMMMEPYDDIIDPLVNNMSSEEDEYFTIPAHKKVSDLRIILENKRCVPFIM